MGVSPDSSGAECVVTRGGYAETIKCGYRKDHWRLQLNYCEVWVEKDAVIGSIEEAADDQSESCWISRLGNVP